MSLALVNLLLSIATLVLLAHLWWVTQKWRLGDMKRKREISTQVHVGPSVDTEPKASP